MKNRELPYQWLKNLRSVDWLPADLGLIDKILREGSVDVENVIIN